MNDLALLQRVRAACPLAATLLLLVATPVHGGGDWQAPAGERRQEAPLAAQVCPPYGNVPGLAMDAGGNPFIANVKAFLDTCPGRDPNLAQILSDFQIFRDGVWVTSFPCTEPVSAMPITQYTDELIYLQVLRAMYYMDRGQSGHLPWTAGTLYDWMRSRLGGVNIVSGMVGGYCCETVGGRTCFVGGTHNDVDREIDKRWTGISNVMAFAAHERRHLDGTFTHTSCCGIPGGCDDTFDTSRLSPYGIQWWLERSWLEGQINVGVGCLSQEEVWQDSQFHLGNANRQYRARFCTNPPPLLTTPASPGGACPPRQCPCPTVTISPTALPAANIAVAYSWALSASGGTAPYTFALASGSLPPGMTLTAGGVLTGTPTKVGAFGFTVQATDAAGCTSGRSYTLSAQRRNLVRRHLLRH